MSGIQMCCSRLGGFNEETEIIIMILGHTVVSVVVHRVSFSWENFISHHS